MHELAFADCPKSYVFRGSKEYQPKQIADMLGLNPSNRAAPRPGQPMPAPAASRFLMQVQECEFQLTNILEGLQRDPWPVEQDRRALRCTGVALGVAVSLLEVSDPQLAGRDIDARPLSPTPVLGSCCSREDPLPTDLVLSSRPNSESQSVHTTTLTEIASSTSSELPRCADRCTGRRTAHGSTTSHCPSARQSMATRSISTRAVLTKSVSSR